MSPHVGSDVNGSVGSGVNGSVGSGVNGSVGSGVVEDSGERFATLPSGIELCYQTFGRDDNPTVLLVMGLGGPMGWWPTEFCERLAERGFRVVRYDNRDTGRSTALTDHPVRRASIARVATGRETAPYSLSDLAGDAEGLLDHLGVAAAHVVGISMGGMIAQTMAIESPERLLSLVSIMSTTGDRRVGWLNPKLLRGLLASRATREDYIEHSVSNAIRIGSPAFPPVETVSRARAEETWDRGWTGAGVIRQLMAVMTQPDRTAALGRLSVPTTVIHGQADPMVHRSGGRATARAIPGARRIEIAGMGHDLPEPLYGQIIDAIAETADRAG